LRLFGQTYSGLEYDYRGLLHVYEELHDNVKYVKFCDVLDEWRILRSDEERVSVKTGRMRVGEGECLGLNQFNMIKLPEIVQN
jgi:hypothetical protein